MRLLMRAAGALCLSLALAATASAQGLQAGIKAGYDRASLAGQAVTGTGFSAKSDFAGGLFLTVPVDPILSVQPELLYVPKGAQATFSESGITATGKFKIDYVEVPLLLRFNIPLANASVRPALYAGPYAAFKMSCKVSASALGRDTTANCNDIAAGLSGAVKSTDLGATFGGGFELPLGGASAMLEARYDLGLTTIDNTSDNADIKNRTFLVLVGFSFPLGSHRAATSRTK